MTTQVTQVNPASLTSVEKYLLGVLIFRPRTTLILENFSHNAWVTDIMIRILKWITHADVWYDDQGLPVAMNLYPIAFSQNMRDQLAQFSHWPQFMQDLFLTVDPPNDPSHPVVRYHLPTPNRLDNLSFDHDLAAVCRFLEFTTLPGTLGCGRIAFPVTGWIVSDTMPQPALLSILSLHYDTIFLYVDEIARQVRWIVVCNHPDAGYS
ncbi:hypothetical protein [Sulfobacillus thermosulfidooxidans]|uniref:hypothetical protein n=1 Tax=Sulfobacillus thermosulfidooxidans TaxID=28034 RepID=UPI0012DF7EC5|nr:hypothetical protein [Sulfobacillus thermosulfidooxidans]